MFVVAHNTHVNKHANGTGKFMVGKKNFQNPKIEWIHLD